jgi:hypothetical protein
MIIIIIKTVIIMIICNLELFKCLFFNDKTYCFL